jgi:putative uncharacterized protein FNV2221
MATLKTDKEKDKSAVTETTETTNNTEINVNTETPNTEVVTQNSVITEIKIETKKEIKEDKTYIYIGEELTKNGFILKHKGFYTSEQLKRIETGISDYDEIKKNFIDLDKYSENR